MAKTSSASRPSRSRRSRRVGRRRVGVFKAVLSLIGWFIIGGTVLGTVALGVYMTHLDGIISAQFEGKRWALPAHVYARPLELYQGAKLSAEQFDYEVGQLLRYRAEKSPKAPGSYWRDGDTVEAITRSFVFLEGPEPVRHIKISFNGGEIQALTALDGLGNPSTLRMEPVQIAGIYPAHREDRILVRREQIPPILIDALLAVEDRAYYDHIGINPKGILRALVANWRAGRTVQGGSTLTQQLVKNYFLSNERTYARKFNEMLMAILLDWHYGKDEILEAYANEVYLGQDGGRAIHGLGLASRFYFDRPLDEMELHHIALLVGLVRGPSQYDPRRFPERAKERRALVLDIMVEQGLVSADDAAVAKEKPLDVSGSAPSGVSPYPAFLDLVQRQLREYYREEDLTSEGLRIFTTLDPLAQRAAEQTLVKKLPQLEKSVGLKSGLLQGAVVIADSQLGEVRALVGGRDVRLAGFNRALDAHRQPGSLVKTVVFLTALESRRYTLASRLDDSTPVVYTTRGGQTWRPQNYDKRTHGRVMLRDALAHSYNIATARLGLDLDVTQVLKTLKRLGVERDFQPYPSVLLGAIDLTPLEVAQMYQTIASGGYKSPLRAIYEVTKADGTELERQYPVQVDPVIEPEPAYLITKALQRVVEAGTASAANKELPKELGLAGKTGTTDDYRDSWFAGFSGEKLAVVWLGRDDNKPTKLSGSKGALPVWIDLMKLLPLQPLDPVAPANIEEVLIDPASGYRADRKCSGALLLPFISGSAPHLPAPCSADYYYGGEHYAPVDTAPAAETDSMENFFKRLVE